MISIVIPAYNEENNIQNILNDLFKQDLSKTSYEIIVVDNGSSDLTKDVVWNFFYQHPSLSLRLVHENRKGVSFAKNFGSIHCKFDYIIFIDADNRVQKDFLSKIKNHVMGTRCAVSTLKILPETFSIRGYIFFHLLNLLKILKLRPFGKVFISKSVFNAIGGFNTSITLGENVDLLVKAKKFTKLHQLFFSHCNKTTILCSLRRFQKQGYIPVIIPWFFAYVGYYKLEYQTVDVINSNQINPAPPSHQKDLENFSNKYPQL
jgi:glycosyltransferase involved in cell wall biosynthesis